MTTIQCTDRWKSGRLATLFAENAEKNSNLSSIEALQFRYGEIRPKPIYDLTDDLKETYKKYALVRPNDIMLNGLNLNYDFVTQRVAQVKSNGIITSAYISLRPREGVSAKYYTYLLKTLDSMKVFNGMGTGIRLTLSYNLLRNLELPIPQHEEQDQIARYLDWQVSKINKLISAKRKQIARINEHLSFAINEAVTHGIVGSELKKSGVYWMGNIPTNWEPIKIKWLFNETNERNVSGAAELLTFSRKKGLIPFSEASDKAPSAADLSNYRLVTSGQLLENRMQAWSGMFICVTRDGCVSPDYSVFNPSSERYVNVKFYEYVFRNPLQVEQFANASRGVGSGFNRLYTPAFGAIYTVYPPQTEQDEIVDYLDKLKSKYQATIDKVELEIASLHEMRDRLVSDVVTGQIDVRGIEVPDFDMVEEIDSDEDNPDDEEAAEETEEQEE